MFSGFFTYLLDTFGSMGYTGVAVLMAVESTIIPLPSELIIPPAAYLAYQGKLNIYLVILAGGIGSLVGASINYLVALLLGRTILHSFVKHKYAKYLLLSEEKLVKSEKFFNKHGNSSIFFGRLVPVIRHLISIPAGIAKMNYFNFALYTLIGSLLWSAVLGALGFYFGKYQYLMQEYYKELNYILLFSGILIFVYIFFKDSIKKALKK